MLAGRLEALRMPNPVLEAGNVIETHEPRGRFQRVGEVFTRIASHFSLKTGVRRWNVCLITPFRFGGFYVLPVSCCSLDQLHRHLLKRWESV